MTTETQHQTDLATKVQAVLDLPLAVEPINYTEPVEKRIPRKPLSRRSLLRGVALRWTNKVRKELGLEPLKKLLPGVISDPSSCTVAASIAYGAPDGLEVDVTSSEIEVNGPKIGARAWHTSDDFGEFIKDFDLGRYPDLATRTEE